MNNLPIISQRKLDVLFERVCRPIQYLSTQMKVATSFWGDAMRMREQIENDVFAVDSVIKEARGFEGKVTNTKVHFYQIILCRVYILLYYLYQDKKYIKR